MLLSDFMPDVCCPQCRSSFKQTKKTNFWFCSDCQTEYPVLNGIPWLFSHPLSVLDQWKSRCHSFLTFVHQQKELAKKENLKVNLMASTRKRLEMIQTGWEHNLHQYKKILSPIVKEDENLKIQNPFHSFDKKGINKVPYKQGIFTYLDLIFRDWAWSQNELNETMQIFDSILPENQTLWHQLCVLGSGAGRFVLELAHRYPQWKIMAADINPVLTFIAHAMNSGDTFELYEFPVAPIDLESTCVKQNLINPLSPSAHVSFLFADALHLPIKNEQLPAILTPWLIDILPVDLEFFIRRLNNYLIPKGEWLNFGPLGFGCGSPSTHYSSREIQDLLSSSGFRIIEWQERRVSYLKSPISGHWREEKIWAFRARKEKKMKEPATYHSLPLWLENHDLPIPKENFLFQLALKSHLQFEILSGIDGHKTVNQLIEGMTKQYGMTVSMAKEALLSFLLKAYEDNIS